MYAWYEDVEPDLEVLLRDAKLVPAAGEQLAQTTGAISGLADRLARGWPRRKAVRAAVGHSLELETYRSLVLRQGLSRKQAVDAMLRLVTASAA